MVTRNRSRGMQIPRDTPISWFIYKLVEKILFVFVFVVQWQWRLALHILIKPLSENVNWGQVSPYGSYAAALRGVKMAAQGFAFPLRAIVSLLALVAGFVRTIAGFVNSQAPAGRRARHRFATESFYDISTVCQPLLYGIGAYFMYQAYSFYWSLVRV
ncbi:hypothetical protein HDE_13292 [Halotydeus destructor]|nr:hypothetical protein HDE_13292 [Halotydeus destructor]